MGEQKHDLGNKLKESEKNLDNQQNLQKYTKFIKNLREL